MGSNRWERVLGKNLEFKKHTNKDEIILSRLCLKKYVTIHTFSKTYSIPKITLSLVVISNSPDGSEDSPPVLPISISAFA